MYTYTFEVRIGGEYAIAVGNYEVKANDYEEAYELCCDHVGGTLAKAFPDWDIEYYVELIETDNKEDEKCFILM